MPGRDRPTGDGSGAGLSPRERLRQDASGPVDGIRPAGGGSSAAKDDRSWRIRNWPLRRKLTAVLLVPLIAAMAFGGLRVVDEVNRAQELDRATEAADAAASAAWTDAVRDGVIVVLVLVLAVAVTIVVARSLTRPLERLRRSAEEVASDRLPSAVDHLRQAKGEASLGQMQPEQVQVFTREEIGEVARSFDEVHSQALRLASEQALLRNNINDLFVNLARRSQTLVQRQLSVIDRLEQDEQDPDQLSSLFELDHLATRMRRNSENLLILGGTDLTRRMMRPVPLSEVVGAAVSEVEQYTRVSVPDPPDLAVQGRVVNDFVHLLAELLENATVFSNPDTEVSVQTAYRRRTLVLEIRDRGVGIDSAELAEINDRLVRLPDVDVAISRRMGLYVVGQLARRHNIGVELRNNTDLEGGITATVQVSGEYVVQLTEDGPKPMPDVQPSPEPRGERSALSDSGSHPGLAAAFQHGGFGDRGPAEVPTERSPLDGDVSAEDATRRAMPSLGTDAAARRGSQPEEELAGRQDPAWQRDPAWDEAPTWQEDVAESGAGFGHDPAEPAEQDWPEEQPWPDEQPWPGAGDADGASDGAAFRDEGVRDEVPEPDLFHSPVEAQKTSEFTALGPDWPSAGTKAPEEPDWGAAAEDDPTQRLPIYEAVLSQWFRESDANDPAGGEGARSAMSSALAATGSQRSSTPEDFREFAGDDEDEGADDDRVTVDGASDGAASEGASAGDTGGAAEHGARNGSARSATAASVVGGRARARAERERSAQAPAPDDAEQPGQPDPGWGSADAGWEAAEALVEPSQQAQSTTSAGLPKRVPQSNLVPGSAASQQPERSAKPTTPRSAEAVRGRMSNFQSGIRRGRHAKAEPDPTEQQSRPNPSRPEEQE